MTSQKQIEANRRNAQLSTGPRTDEGKALAARNAIQHGILSAHVPLDRKEKTLYLHFSEGMKRELSPRNDLEAFLVDRIISTAWRLRRILHVETLMFQKAQEGFSYRPTYRSAFEGKCAANMAVLSRYERSLENAFFRTMREFQALREKQNLEILEISS